MSHPAPTEVIPHRDPFLFLDEVVALEPGRSARARWTLPPDAPFLAGHFPGHPILPGVIIIEALAQTGALAVLSLPENQGKLALFAGIEKARFRRPVRPGETLDLECALTRHRGPVGEGQAVARVDGQVACQATLRFAVTDADPSAAG
ncbi:MAG: 3-hydroxyacyl-ACP dehydratase FabZ [Thermoleophilia bacterium]|nr:3-hydroxyacyl-ACP dehydratase FabZ [Thermoleophilia bacterium]